MINNRKIYFLIDQNTSLWLATKTILSCIKLKPNHSFQLIYINNRVKLSSVCLSSLFEYLICMPLSLIAIIWDLLSSIKNPMAVKFFLLDSLLGNRLFFLFLLSFISRFICHSQKLVFLNIETFFHYLNSITCDLNSDSVLIQLFPDSAILACNNKLPIYNKNFFYPINHLRFSCVPCISVFGSNYGLYEVLNEHSFTTFLINHSFKSHFKTYCFDIRTQSTYLLNKYHLLTRVHCCLEFMINQLIHPYN